MYKVKNNKSETNRNICFWKVTDEWWKHQRIERKKKFWGWQNEECWMTRYSSFRMKEKKAYFLFPHFHCQHPAEKPIWPGDNSCCRRTRHAHDTTEVLWVLLRRCSYSLTSINIYQGLRKDSILKTDGTIVVDIRLESLRPKRRTCLFFRGTVLDR